MRFTGALCVCQIQTLPCVDWSLLPRDFRSWRGVLQNMESCRQGTVVLISQNNYATFNFVGCGSKWVMTVMMCSFRENPVA